MYKVFQDFPKYFLTNGKKVCIIYLYSEKEKGNGNKGNLQSNPD